MVIAATGRSSERLLASRIDRRIMISTRAADAAAARQSAQLTRLGVRPPLGRYLRMLWDRRDFIVALPVGQLRGRNANTLFGGFWHLLNPAILAGTYYLVFGVFFSARGDVENYIGFLVTGLFVFFYSQKCLTGGASTTVANAGIIKNVNLPRAVFPCGSVLAETLAHLPALALLLAMVLVTGEAVALSWLFLPGLVLIQGVFNLGLAFWVGRLTFHFRDVQNIIPYATRLWLYLSGVFFTVGRVPEGILRDLFEFNPMHVYITAHREILLEGSVSLSTFVAASLWAIITLISGFFFFWASEDRYGRD